MHRRLSRGAWVVLLILASVAGLLRSASVKDPAADRIAALIKQLGEDVYARREAASRGLEAIGEAALPALRDAAAASKDLEIRFRARGLIRTILLACRTSRSTGLETAVIDAGEFLMGSSPAVRGDEFQHQVRITRPFLLGVYEVTQEDYLDVMGKNPSRFAATGGGRERLQEPDTGRFPVDSVSWFDAVEFCNRLSGRDGYQPYYVLGDPKRERDSIRSASVTIAGGNGYRLPTEAEWEFACRSGTTTRFHFGDANSGREANLRPSPGGGYAPPPTWETLERTTGVGSYAPNDSGLFDMHGNAAEWCWDWYDKDYYAHAPADDPAGPADGLHRAIRGGSWLVNELSCRSASRFWHTPDERKDHVGFRVARTP